MRGTLFGTLHSARDLHLIQQSVEVQPAAPKTNYVSIPGADGSLDLTEALGGGVKFEDREIHWTFALQPGEGWENAQMRVSNALNGLACHIVLDQDPDYDWIGRLTVSEHKYTDRALRQISVTAVCRPYKLHRTVTALSYALNTDPKEIVLVSDRMPVCPEITVTVETQLIFGDSTYTLSPGSTWKLVRIQLQEGANRFVAQTISGTGTITFTYQEGAL